MERKPYALFALLLAAAPAVAQPTLNAGNNTPVAGQVVPVNTGTVWQFPGGTGADVLYGFWMLDSTGNKNLKYLDPSVTSSSAIVGAANLLFTDGGSDTAFYEYSSTGIKWVGQRSPLEGLVNFSDAAQELVYPCTFGTSWTDALGATYSTAFGNATRVGTLTGIADGYGTLELPEDLVPNVLRVKVRRDVTDQTAIATVHRISTTYSFYSEDQVHPVLRLQEDSVSINGGAYSVQRSAQWMFNGGNVGMADLAQVRFQAYPNPVADQLVLDLGAAQGRADRLVLVDAKGGVVREQRIARTNGPLTLNMADLPSGTYLVRVQGDGLVLGTHRVVVR